MKRAEERKDLLTLDPFSLMLFIYWGMRASGGFDMAGINIINIDHLKRCKIILVTVAVLHFVYLTFSSS